ncbi:MAG: phenylacetate--CoA ligase [Oscillospiraceae bacterium]|nr:phenylacetate--CoA ligase [Oscillospiraceae bacterium]
MFNPSIEAASPDELHALQSARLAATVARAYNNVPFYRELLDAHGVQPGDIRSIDDITRLPFTMKSDLRDHYPFGLFAVPRDEIVRIHASSGTTGKPTVVGYTRHDLDIWSEGAARALAAAGAHPGDIVHISYGYGLFTGGLGLHYGAEKLGASALPVSSGNTARQVQLMQDFGSDILCCTPSYAMYIGETVRDMGIDPHTLPLRAGVFGAEPWTEEMREQIEELLAIKAYDIYGLSEVAGPGVSYGCDGGQGMHVCEDFFYPEIVDPDTLEPVPDGTYGELVFTCIGKEALPLIRYRTRDVCALHHGTCACGRTTVRMERLRGRTDDMLIIRGVNVFPSQIEHVLLAQGMAANYLIVVNRERNLDTLEVQVEMGPAQFSDTVRAIEGGEKMLEAALQSLLNVHARVRLVEQGSLPRSEGKAKRVVDKRK